MTKLLITDVDEPQLKPVADRVITESAWLVVAINWICTWHGRWRRKPVIPKMADLFLSCLHLIKPPFFRFRSYKKSSLRITLGLASLFGGASISLDGSTDGDRYYDSLSRCLPYPANQGGRHPQCQAVGLWNLGSCLPNHVTPNIQHNQATMVSLRDDGGRLQGATLC